VALSGSCFTIGRHGRCSLQIKDSSISGILCKLSNLSGSVFLEVCSNSAPVSVNRYTLKRGIRTQIRSGDEILIAASKTYIFVSSHCTISILMAEILRERFY
jgi:predicted component of type VI protein secretion system